MTRLIITIDGLAGSGKSTLAAQLASRIGFIHFSSGILYRAAGYLANKHRIDVSDEDAVLAAVKPHNLELVVEERAHAGNQIARAVALKIDSKLSASELYTPAISEATSQVSKHPRLRELLLEPQRSACGEFPLVAEGRDMGTVVFPASPLKFFIEVPVAVRVQRRLAQLAERGVISRDNKELELSIRQEIIERDARDSERSVAPTAAAADAIVVDNSSPNLTQTLDFMYSLARERGLIQ